MASQTIVVLLLAFSVASEVHGQVWEFGKDTPESTELYHYSGSIPSIFNEKIIYIPVTDAIIDYIKVEVDSNVGGPLPSVTYDKYGNFVAIYYTDKTHGKTTYDFVVKGHRRIYNEHTNPAASRRYYGYGNYGGYSGYCGNCG